MLCIKGLERRSWNEPFCHFCGCCHGRWSWNELDLLWCWLFLPFVCSFWRLGSWKELSLVLSFKFWPVTGLRSWKMVLKWLVVALSTTPGLRTAPCCWLCLPIYVVNFRQIIGYDLFQYLTWFWHNSYTVPGWDLTWHSLGVQWWSLSEVGVSTMKNLMVLKWIFHIMLRVTVWSFHDSPACHHHCIGVLSLILSGHLLLGSHPHLICGGTLT